MYYEASKHKNNRASIYFNWPGVQYTGCADEHENTYNGCDVHPKYQRNKSNSSPNTICFRTIIIDYFS